MGRRASRLTRGEDCASRPPLCHSLLLCTRILSTGTFIILRPSCGRGAVLRGFASRPLKNAQVSLTSARPSPQQLPSFAPASACTWPRLVRAHLRGWRTICGFRTAPSESVQMKKPRAHLLRGAPNFAFLDGAFAIVQLTRFVSPPPALSLLHRGLAGVRRLEHHASRRWLVASLEHEKERSCKVTFRNQELSASRGEKLRDVLLRSAPVTSPHNGRAKIINCRGLGTCGTCAVSVVAGSLLPPEPSVRETARLGFPPHMLERSRQKRLRLACQARVDGDVEIVKYDRFWGQGDNEQPYDVGSSS